MKHRRDPDELLRLPGLYRRWELCQLLEPGCSYHLEDAGVTGDGTALLAVYRDASSARPRSGTGS